MRQPTAIRVRGWPASLCYLNIAIKQGHAQWGTSEDRQV